MLSVDRTLPRRRYLDCRPVYRRSVAPTTEPVSIDRVKRNAQTIDDGSIDDLFAGWLKAARERVETDAVRSILTQTWELFLDRFPHEAIELERPPIQSVTSVEYLDEAGAWQTADTAIWDADVNSEPGLVYRNYGQTWPFTLPQARGAVKVTFVAGWTSAPLVPAAVCDVITRLASHYALDRELSTTPDGYDDLLRRIAWGGKGA